MEWPSTGLEMGGRLGDCGSKSNQRADKLVGALGKIVAGCEVPRGGLYRVDAA